MKFVKKACLLLGMACLLTGCGSKAGESNQSESETQVETNQNDSGTQESIPDSTANDTKNEDITVIDIGVFAESEKERLLAGFEGMEEEIGIGINIVSYASSSDFWNNIAAQIAAGTAPDVISCTNEHYLQYIEEGLFVPLNESIDDGTINIDGILPAAMDAWDIDGSIYGIPYALNPGVFIVNNTLWQELDMGDYPDTWDEVLEVCKDYKEKTGDPALCVNLDVYHLTNIALSFGGGWGRGTTINSPENAAAVQFIIDAYREGYVVTPSELGLGWDGAVMVQQSALFSTGGAWYQSMFASEAPDIELKYLPVPKGNGSDGGLTLHTAALVALKNSDNADAVNKAIGYAISNEKLFNATVEVTEVIPAKTAYFDIYRTELPELAELVDYLDDGVPFSYPAASTAFSDEFVSLLQTVLFDDSSDLTGQDIVDTLAESFGG